MTINALLICEDRQSLQVMAAALNELEMECELCASTQWGMERLVQEYYSAVIVDFDLPGAAQVAKLARMVAPQRRPVVFGMLGAMAGVADAFQAGANFVIYKPLMWEQLMRSLRAGHGFMRPDRRRSRRHPTSAIVYLKIGETALPSMMLNLSPDGISVQAPEPLPALPEIPLRFHLPGSAHLVEGAGEVLWADDTGRAGLFFTRLTSASRKHLKQWLSKRETVSRTPFAAPRFGSRPSSEVAPD
jgi:CheY-like chemotaxis protein